MAEESITLAVRTRTEAAVGSVLVVALIVRFESSTVLKCLL